MSEQLVTDLESLFRYSGLLDQVRDSAKYLSRVGAPADTAQRMARQYNEVALKLRGVLREDLAGEVDVLIGALDEDTATMPDVYAQAAALARWVDVVHQTPQFLLSQEVASANAREVKGKVASLMSRNEDDSPVRAISSSLGTGQYL